MSVRLAHNKAMIIPHRVTVGLLFIAVCPLGCGESGPTRYKVSGTVTYDGQPVPYGMIHFEPDSSKGNTGPSGSGEIVNGNYETSPARGAIGGPHVVRISGYDGNPPPGDEGKMFTHGMPLFDEYLTSVDLPSETSTQDFEVPVQQGEGN